MKKIVVLSLVIGALFACTMLNGCTNSHSIDYNSKLQNATEYSFNIVYTTNTSTDPIYISCYMKNGEYAYRFSQNGFNNENLAYRQIFADNTFYEICESKKNGLWVGEFKKTEQVQVTYDKNFMYKYSVYITHGAYATLFTEGTPIEYKGVPCTQMQIEFEGKLITYVFETESSNLVKFVLVDGENITTLEYSDYKFDSIDTECLTLPNTGIQIGTVQLYREVTDFTYEYFIS